jgi:hypothetical protein
LKLKRRLLAAVLVPVKLVAAPVMAKIGEIYIRRKQRKQLLEFVDDTDLEEIEVDKL